MLQNGGNHYYSDSFEIVIWDSRHKLDKNFNFGEYDLHIKNSAFIV
jgi:hypothetical protein